MNGHLHSCAANRIYDIGFTVEKKEGGRTMECHATNRGGFVGKAALIVPDHDEIDQLNSLFEVTEQVAGDRAELCVRLLGSYTPDILVHTLAPKDDDAYESSMVRITLNPVVAAVTGIQDDSKHLIEFGDFTKLHVEDSYGFRAGFVARATLAAIPAHRVRKGQHVNPGQHTFQFHLGLRLSDADSCAYPIIMDATLPEMGEDVGEGRFFDVDSDSTDRIIFLGSGQFRTSADYAVSGKLDRVYFTADEAPVFTQSKRTRYDGDGNVLNVSDNRPGSGDGAEGLDGLLGLLTGLNGGELPAGFGEALPGFKSVLEKPSQELMDKMKARVEAGEDPMKVCIDGYGEHTGRDVTHLHQVLGSGGEDAFGAGLGALAAVLGGRLRH